MKHIVFTGVLNECTFLEFGLRYTKTNIQTCNEGLFCHKKSFVNDLKSMQSEPSLSTIINKYE